MYMVKQNVSSRKGINARAEQVEVNGKVYEFYYIPIEESLNLILSNEIIMEHLFDWHNSEY